MATVKADQAKFRQKLKANLKNNIKNIINGDFTSIKGGKMVEVPVDQIHIPRLRYDKEGEGEDGVGRGEGKDGLVIGSDDSNNKGSKAGNAQGKHGFYAEFTAAELAEILGDELELPRIVPKGQRELEGDVDKYDTIATAGPRSLRHKKRTLKKSILRGRPGNIPFQNDFEYKSFTRKPSPMNSAVIFYMQDVSSSMSREQLEIVRTICFWIEQWLEINYDKLDIRYILHDTVAGEVTKEDFYMYSPNGGTYISTAFEKMNERIKKSYPIEDWNIYPFYFGDGENWSEDTNKAIEIIRDELLEISNQLSIGLIENDWGSVGRFPNDLISEIPDELVPKIVIQNIKSINECFDAIKGFLGKGN